MSQFAASQGSEFASLAALATRAGQGQAFLTRHEQGQQLVDQSIRQLQVHQQREQAAGEREIQLQELAARNEAQRFEQAIMAQREQREQEQAQVDADVDAREKELATALKIRQIERLEADLGLRTRGQELAEQRFEHQQIEDQSPRAISKRRTQTLQDLARVNDMLSPENFDISDRDRIILEGQRQQLTQDLVSFEEQSKRFAQNAARQAQVTQTQRAVTAKEAGPALRLSLKAAGQSRVEQPKFDPETGAPDPKQFKIGKIYQLPDGPAVFLGDGRFEIIDELGDVDITRNLQQ